MYPPAIVGRRRNANNTRRENCKTLCTKGKYCLPTDTVTGVRSGSTDFIDHVVVVGTAVVNGDFAEARGALEVL